MFNSTLESRVGEFEMTTQLRKIENAICETAKLLEEAILKHEHSKKYLEMEITENKEFANDDSSNDHAREHVKEREERVKFLRNHLQSLNQMKLAIIS